MRRDAFARVTAGLAQHERARITQVIRSTSVDFATASWIAHDTCWPFPVRQRYSRAATIESAICSPAMWKACHICGAIGGRSYVPPGAGS